MRRPNNTATSALLAAFLFVLPVTALAQGSISSDIQRAETLIAQGDYVEALAAVRSASTQAPSDYRVRYYSGMALLGLQRFDEARKETELALSLAPEADKAVVERLLAAIDLQSVSLTAEADAEAALAGGLNGRAARLFAQAFEADNTKTEAGFRAAELYAGALNQPVEAVKILRKIETQSSDGAARVKASEELKKLESVFLPLVAQLSGQIMMEIDVGDVVRASELLANARALDPTQPSIIAEGVRFTALGDDGRALESALMSLASKGVEIDDAIWKLPKAQHWAAQDWFVQLLIDYRGAGYAEKIRKRMLHDPATFRDCPLCPEMVTIPSGSFLMGGPSGPPKAVNISYSLAVGKYEITKEQYAYFVSETKHAGSSPCHGAFIKDSGGYREQVTWQDPGFSHDNTHPVVCVSWSDAQAYVSWLNGKLGLSGKPDRYRLLSASEFEYANRAGTTGRYPWPNTEYKYGRCIMGNGTGQPDALDITARCDDPYQYTAPVGQFPSNAFGLHDMDGNVSEFVQDCYEYKNGDTPNDGSAFTKNGCDVHVTLGGDFYTSDSNRLAGYRNQGFNNFATGFRVGRTMIN